MKTIIGLIICILSVILGFYLGVYVMFIGGIVQLIQSITPVIIAQGIAFGLVKIMLSGAVGWLSFFGLFGIGQALLD